MAEELEQLLTRIEKEVIDEAGERAEKISADARQHAARMIREAEEKAEAIVREAENKAKQFEERSLETIGLASRDFILRIGEEMGRLFHELAGARTGEALTMDLMRDLIVRMVDAYASDGSEGAAELLVSPEDQAEVLALFQREYAERLDEGLEIRPDEDISRGFRLSLVEERVFHDFTHEAIAEGLAVHLRAPLNEIIYGAARRVADENGSEEPE